MKQQYRGDGTTTKQMQAAPAESVFIWCNGHLEYPRKLARKLGRDDLKIVGPSWLTEHRWAGISLTGITVDHATTLQRIEYYELQRANAQVRPSSQSGSPE